MCEGGEEEKLVIVSLFNRHVFSELVAALHRQIIYDKRLKNQFFILFTMPISETVHHGFRYIVERNRTENGRNYISKLEEHKLK